MNASHPLYRLAAHGGSLRAALVLIALLGGVVLAGTVTSGVSGLAVAVVCGLLGANLLAALVVHPLLRRRLPLLVFHLALLALVGLVAWGRLASLDGRFELTEGVPFDGQLLDEARGPLYGGALAQLSFRHDGLEIDYAPGLRRGATRNRVSWSDAQGRVQRAIIGDHRPLVLQGHRFYTSPNKGFAPLLQWQALTGAPVVGAVHLPSYPMLALTQSRAWTLPDGREAWVQLQFDETLIDPQADSAFRLPGLHRLVLRVGAQRHELVPGASVEVDGARYTYLGLRTWMGYRVSHDPSLPWLLAAALVALAALLWHEVAAWSGASLARGSRTAPALEPQHG